MFFCIIIFIFFSQSSYSLSKKEVRTFSNSKVWNNLLYIENDKSLVTSDRFFLSSSQKRNPLIELEKTIISFREDLKNEDGHDYSCVFTARAYVLYQKWPHEFPLKNCKQYNEWKERLDAGNVFLVYSSVYPNNPASMFGHTFFRVDRNTKGSGQSEKAILGYSLAFQARTSNEDNPFIYTFKGLFGGYPAFLDIKPHYIDLGVYNNLESRDIWEYPLAFSENEKELFLRLMWEMSLTTSFDYYFFNKNCSTFLLKALAIIRPDLTFESLEDIFVVPQETLKEVVKKFSVGDMSFRPSIKRKISKQYLSLSREQKENFSMSLLNLEDINKNNDVEVLNVLVDYWKLKNYKEKLALNHTEKKLMFNTFLQRSKLKSQNKEFSYDLFIDKVRPDLGHHLSRVSTRFGEGESRVSYRYGFHDFFDSPIGYDSSSYIRFLDAEVSLNKNYIDMTVADILSLQDYLWHLPQFSWRGQLNFSKRDEDKKGSLNALGGVSHLMQSSQIFVLVGTSLLRDEKMNLIIPIANLGYKYEFSDGYMIVLDYIYSSEKTNRNYKLELKKTLKDINYLITVKEKHLSSFVSIGAELYF